VFERFEEKARRVIFFARYEASILGRPCIEPEHLLLGIFREDKATAARIGPPQQVAESLQKRILEKTPAAEKIATSVDLPMSKAGRQALVLAAKEAGELGHKTIAVGHLLLGVLRVGGLATEFLQENGLELQACREKVSQDRISAVLRPPTTDPLQRVRSWEESETAPPATPALALVIEELTQYIGCTVENISLDEEYAGKILKRKPWSRKQAMGHLVDLASAYHQWLARALTESRLVAAGYPGDEWVAAQNYTGYSWKELVDLWVSLNRLIAHVLAIIPPGKMNMECRIGIEEPKTLWEVVQRYSMESADLVGQILAKLE
jgi:hypothetical protein